MLFRQYDYESDDYEDCQLKIINSTLAVTDDNWLHVKTAIGKYYYIDPETNQVKYDFGVNAETIIGNLILGEKLGIYNESGSLTFNQNGFNVTNSKNTFNINPNATNLLTIYKTNDGNTENIFYVDENGILHIKGDGSALDISANDSVNGLSTRITQNSNNISLIANKDGNGTVLSLKSDAVKIAWNNISQYVQFDTVSSRAGLSIYNSSSNRIVRLDNSGLNINNNSGNDLMKLNTSGLNLYGKYDNDNNTYLLMSLNSTGQNYYYKNDSNSSPTKVGTIGTGAWADDSTFRGLKFGLNYGSDYMCWGCQEEENGNYNVKLIYYANDRKNSKGLHILDTTYCNDLHCQGLLYLNDNVRTAKYTGGGAGIYSDTNDVSIVGKTATVKGSDGTFKIDEGKFIFYNSTNKLVDCFNNIDMHGYSILNQSDIRLKTNVLDTNVNALDLLNQIEMKSFDWIEDNKHEAIGIIAQQLKEILPDLVYEDNSTTKLSIKYINFIPYLIKAIQELSEKVNQKSKQQSNEKYKSQKSKNKYYYSQQEIDSFLEKIKPKNTTEKQQEEKNKIDFKPIYIENQFKQQEKKGKVR